MSLDIIIGESSNNVFIRPSLFLTSISGTNAPNILENEEVGGGLLIKTTSLPGTSIGTIEIPYRGRKAYIPSTRQLPGDITMTVLYHMDQDWHSDFTDWMNSFQLEDSSDIGGAGTLETDTMTIVSRNPTDPGLDFHRYTLYGCIPTSIGAAELSAESAESILEFQVNIQYTYHTVT
jgi:hypothetical protein